MLRTMVLVATLLAASVATSSAQLLKLNCQTQGTDIQIAQSSKTELESKMDHNGCRYSYNTAGTLEKFVIMKTPINGELTQVGEFSVFYKPRAGFIGKDSFTVYLCGTGRRGGSGCARLNYNVTVQ